MRSTRRSKCSRTRGSVRAPYGDSRSTLTARLNSCLAASTCPCSSSVCPVLKWRSEVAINAVTGSTALMSSTSVRGEAGGWSWGREFPAAREAWSAAAGAPTGSDFMAEPQAVMRGSSTSTAVRCQRNPNIRALRDVRSNRCYQLPRTVSRPHCHCGGSGRGRPQTPPHQWFTQSSTRRRNGSTLSPVSSIVAIFSPAPRRHGENLMLLSQITRSGGDDGSLRDNQLATRPDGPPDILFRHEIHRPGLRGAWTPVGNWRPEPSGIQELVDLPGKGIGLNPRLR